MKRSLKVIVLGLRGIPNVQGGVETHAEQLYRRLAVRGCDIEVVVRAGWVPAQLKEHEGIRLRHIWAPARSGFEALIHSLIGVLYAGIRRPDILHIHAVGPAIVTPIARLLGIRVVVTHHGPDYDRDKWGRLARWILLTGERWGMRYAHRRIVISSVIQQLVRNKYGLDAALIPNGVNSPSKEEGVEHVLDQGLSPRQYLLLVSRMVPEKRQLDLMKAFAMARPPGWKLALVGKLEGDSYSQKVMQCANLNDSIVLTDFLGGKRLRQVFSHAGVFVLPSSHEGLPIALLEALSHGLPVIASDIPANLEIGLPPESYFPVGDISALADRIGQWTACPLSPEAAEERRKWVVEKYNWSSVADRTLAVYEELISEVG